MTRDHVQRIPIADLQENANIEQVFLCNSAARKEARNGKPYITAEFSDNTGAIRANMWDADESWLPRFNQGGLARVRCRVELYRGQRQLRVRGVEPADADVEDISAFLPHTTFNIDQLWTELEGRLRSMENPWLLQLAEIYLADGEFRAKLRAAPAAKRIHHAHIGGLLEHTVSCLKLADLIARFYPVLERDVVMMGVFLHDLGKINELRYDTAIEYTVPGQLLGHITQGAFLLNDMAARIPGFPESLRDQLTHIILSHHGVLEFGSPKVPLTLEAFVVHTVDNLDGKIFAWTRDREAAQENAPFSEFSKTFSRRLYRGPILPGDEAGVEKSKGEPGDLFD